MNDTDRLLALYLTLQPVSTALITQVFVNTHSQRNVIEQTIKNPHLIVFPPALDYQRRFWKNVISVLEEKDMEIEGEIYEHLVKTLSVPVRQGAPEASYLTYLLRQPEFGSFSTEMWHRPPGIDNFSQDQRPLTILESRTTIERGTTGLRTWRASLDLAEWILQNSHIVSSARILELGSGAGLLGLLVAALQRLARPNGGSCLKKAPCIYMTDVDDDVLRRCAYNLRLSCNVLDESPDVHVRALDWTDSVDPDRQARVRALLEEIDADVILAADVVYDLSIIPPLTRTLRLALERPLPDEQSSHCDTSSDRRCDNGFRHCRVAYVALTPRREQSIEAFLASSEREGLIVDSVEMSLPPEEARIFRGTNDSASRGTGGTRLLRLTVTDVGCH